MPASFGLQAIDTPPDPGTNLRGEQRARGMLLRLAALAAVGVLHLVVYMGVTRLTLLRPSSAFIDPVTAVDRLVPYLPWTWPAYWLPYVGLPLVATGASRVLERKPFSRLIFAWSGMILAGGVIQLVWPATAPWPDAPSFTQRLFHDSALVLPYATLPSMHVAHMTFASLVVGSLRPSHRVRWLAAAATLVVATATLTLREHVLLDAIAGFVLALATWALWRADLW